MLTNRILIIATALAVVACGQNVTPVIPADKAVEAKVEKVLKGMTLQEKAGQIVQINISMLLGADGELDQAKLDKVIGEYKIGSILNVQGDRAHSREETAAMVRRIQEKSMEAIGIPCLYGLDMIHGASYLTDGTFYPQEINIAATFNREYARQMGRTMAYETRAAQVPWVFSPVMDLGRDPRWPRQWESYGEDPFLQAEMAREETLAIQGDDPNNVDLEHCAVSIKHFMGYGVPVSGKDRTPAIIAENDLREKFFAPFLECFRAGALTAMVNSASINGIPTHANEKVLTQWVKKDLGWDGMYVTDWADIDNLFVRDHVAADKKEAVALGINAGIDMIMDPYDITCCDVLVQCVNEGLIPMSRIDDAVRRILRLKVRLGLFDNPVWEHEYPEFASEQFARESYQAAVESEVLLKNDGILPLKGTEKILVCGPNANTLRAMNGGWSYTWQGSADDFVPQYNTIFEALFDRFPGKVSWVPGVVYDERFYQWEKDIAINVPQAVAAARKADVVICCVGENSYCETPGNTDDINLSANQKELVKAVAATGKPVILVLNEGRPRLIGDIEPLAKAVVDVMLPSNYGGNALAALLAGDENFSGKLPFTYSKHINALHTYDYKVSEHRETMEGSYNYDAVMDVQWPFGHGLSYTTFAYSGLNVAISSFSGLSRESLTFSAEDVLKVSVKVTNTGSRAGKEAVLLYSSDLVASLIPDVKRLRGFEKIALEPGESKVVEFEVPAKALAFVGPDGRWRLEAGDFRLAIGGLGQIVTCTKTKVWDTPNI